MRSFHAIVYSLRGLLGYDVAWCCGRIKHLTLKTGRNATQRHNAEDLAMKTMCRTCCISSVFLGTVTLFFVVHNIGKWFQIFKFRQTRQWQLIASDLDVIPFRVHFVVNISTRKVMCNEISSRMAHNCVYLFQSDPPPIVVWVFSADIEETVVYKLSVHFNTRAI
jgi:hypothetical protein